MTEDRPAIEQIKETWSVFEREESVDDPEEWLLDAAAIIPALIKYIEKLEVLLGRPTK